MSNYLDKKKILSSLTEDELIKVVCSLGSLPPKKTTKGELIFQTICHNKPSPDNSWKLYYFPPDGEYTYGSFYCFSKCQDKHDLVELVIRAKRTQGKTVTYYKALNYSDVSIVPSIGKVESRSEIPLEGYRIIIAGMSSVLSEALLKEWMELPQDIRPLIPSPTRTQS